jgi:hypothetical protein
MLKDAMCDPENTRLTKSTEEAVRWRVLHQTVREARQAFADVSPDEIQKMIDEAVEDVRAKRYRELGL